MRESARSSEVRVLGKTYKVRPFQDTLLKTQAAGANDVKLALIEYDPQMTKDQVKDTLLHEIVHILDYDFQLEMSERQVHCLASGLFSVFKDNPDLSKWILTSK